MKKKTSRKRHLFLTKNFIMMLVMLVVIIVAVSAWFFSRSTAEAGGISVRTMYSGIDIAPCVKTYNSDGSVKTDGPGQFGNVISFNVPTEYGKFVKDCTGDGVNLIIPEFNVTKDYDSVRRHGGKEVNVNLPAALAKSNLDVESEHIANPDNEVEDFQYLEFEFYVRSKSKDLKLAAQSRVVSETEINNSAISNYTNAKKSDYGNFNVDGLVGAIRVSLIGEGCTSVTQMWDTTNNTVVEEGANAPTSVRLGRQKQILWMPRPDVRLDVSETPGNITSWQLETGQTTGDSYKASYYVRNGEGNAGTGVSLVENDENAVISSGTASEGSVSVKALGTNQSISDFTYSDDLDTINLRVSDTNSNTENYYVTKYTMRVWIEGTDLEARRAMDGGKFTIKLFFE